MEEVVRVPMAIRWPAAIEAGQRRTELVSNMDATATMLDAAGIATPDYMHSRSVLPLCQSGENAGWADELICEHNGHGGHVFPQRMVLHDRYKYVFSLHDMDELYDLQDDPFELNNLVHSAEHVDLIEELRARLIRHFGASTERDMRLKRFFLLALENNL